MFLDCLKNERNPSRREVICILIQTKGGGYYLYHSLVASDKVNMTDTSILQTYIYGKIAEWASSATQANGTFDVNIGFVC